MNRHGRYKKLYPAGAVLDGYGAPCYCKGMANLIQTSWVGVVRRTIAAMALAVAMQTVGVDPVSAGEAQAALMGQATDHRYEIPASLNQEEQRWYKIFQEGNFVSEGWQDISAEILAKTPAEQRSAQKVALDNLGRKIGMEWCRPNTIRKVDSTMLLEWGDILRSTARKSPHQLGKAIAYIDHKVDAVLD